ncbi:MAG: hypothetical protein HZY74_12635 [Brevundimonas sp.]|nr:MAG: hypothetical protein HZY74_12635 [Brevundimonas sp.]
MTRADCERVSNRSLLGQFSRSLLLAVLLLAAVVLPARAEVVLTLSAHAGLRTAGVYSLYPHAFIHLKGTLDGTGEAVDESIGFGATSFGPHLLFSSVPGEIGRPGNLQINNGVDYISIPISDATYAAIKERVAFWSTREGGTYNLRRRNCIHFVVDIAQLAGLQVPTVDPMSPNRTMIEAAALNPTYALGPEGVPHVTVRDEAPVQANLAPAASSPAPVSPTADGPTL